MQYFSTRGHANAVSGAQAIVSGIAPDGGLYVPEFMPSLSYDRIIKMQELNYPELAAAVLAPFLTRYTEEERVRAATRAYSESRFTHPEICPLVPVESGLYALELWHGPTGAFKDMALQILPHLLITAREKCEETRETVILVATSGDTGKAALEGFRDVPGTRVVVFYPEEGVSSIQRLQMVTQEGSNVGVVAVQGNFDDAQTGVKQIFADSVFQKELEEQGFSLSSANSINWGRLVPQIAYYFSAYHALLGKKAIRAGEAVNIAVPTGNFGNILAAYYARAMGLPVHRLICATNANNILEDFLQTGVYDTNRSFHKTQSPSMDILISSNLERLLYAVTDQDSTQVRAWMASLAENGQYAVNGDHFCRIQAIFWAGSASERETTAAMGHVYRSTGYLMDPHTAVGYHVTKQYIGETGDDRATILASTASPFKFGRAVAAALDLDGHCDETTLLNNLARHTGWPVPAYLAGLSEKKVRHETVCLPMDMKKAVRQLLGVPSR